VSEDVSDVDGAPEVAGPGEDWSTVREGTTVPARPIRKRPAGGEDVTLVERVGDRRVLAAE